MYVVIVYAQMFIIIALILPIELFLILCSVLLTIIICCVSLKPNDSSRNCFSLLLNGVDLYN